MTFPTEATTASSSQTTDATTHTVTMPSGISAGDKLTAAVSFDGRPSVTGGTLSDNWQQIFATADSGDNVSLVVWQKVSDGTEGSSQTITIGTAQTSASRVWRFAGASTITAIESAITQGSSAGTAPDPPTLNPTNWGTEDTLWIALGASDNGTVTATAFPTSYTNTGQVNSGNAADGVTLSWATRANAVASEDPSAFTLSSSEEWCTATLAIRPVAPVEFVSVGAKSAGSATATSIAYPTGIAAGRLVLAGRAGWRSDLTMANEAGWTNTAELGGGTGTAIDAHTTKIRVDRLEQTGSESGSVTFDESGSTNPGCLGIMLNYANAAATTWDVATSTGTDDTHGANRSATGSGTVSFQPGDVLVAFVAVDTDTSLATFSAPALTASGITFDTTTRRSPASAGVTTGDDGNIEAFDATVSSGTGTVAPTLAFTTGTSQCGPVAFVRLRAASSGVTGTVAATQAAQTSSASGQLGYTASGSPTQGNQTSTATGVGPFAGTVAVTQATQTASASGQLGYSAAAAPSQAAQTAAASGTNVAFNGSGSPSQADQTSTASGKLGYSGSGSPTQATQTASASGTVTAPGVSGTAAPTQAEQTGSATGQLGYTATASTTPAAQTGNASGQLGYAASSAATQGHQTSTGVGQLGVSASAAATQQAQTAAASGTVAGIGPITGTAAVPQASQTSSASGQLGYSSTAAAVQASQLATATGWISITGAVAVVQADQIAAVNGVARPPALPPGGQHPLTVSASRLARR